MPTFKSHRKHVPDSLKRHEHWVLWGLDEQGRKRPLAPWLRGDLYPVKWGSDAPERPETDWQTAHQHWKHRDTYSAPSGMDKNSVLPAPLLLHDPLDPPLMQVDFDDVREPSTGKVSQEVADIVDRLGGFCEVSQSGEGLHVFVRAELPGGLGKFIADLYDIGEIELYDHGRAVGATWDHVDGTPTDVPEAQETVEEIVQEYEDQSQRNRRVSADGAGAPSSYDGSLDTDTPTPSSGDGGVSPYFDIDIRQVADTGDFKRYRRDAPGDDWTGPHPAHGPQSSDKDDCTNFGAVPGDNVWFCFLCDSGGRAIELGAVLCPLTNIRCADVPGENQSVGGWLRNKPMALLKTCVWLREQGAIADDAKPPHAALLATADLLDMHVRNLEEGIIGEQNAEILREVYDDLRLDDLR